MSINASRKSDAEWDVIRRRYVSGVTRDRLMKDHLFTRSEWRRHLLPFEADHHRKKDEISQRMMDLYIKRPSTPMHMVPVMLDIESVVVEDLWPKMRRVILRDETWQLRILDEAKRLAQEGPNIRDALARAFGYRDWDKLRTSVIWRRGIYNQILDLVTKKHAISHTDITPVAIASASQLTYRPTNKPNYSVTSFHILGTEDKIEYILDRGEVFYRYRNSSTPQLRYYCRKWEDSPAYRRIHGKR